VCIVIHTSPFQYPSQHLCRDAGALLFSLTDDSLDCQDSTGELRRHTVKVVLYSKQLDAMPSLSPGDTVRLTGVKVRLEFVFNACCACCAPEALRDSLPCMRFYHL
jgi:hypothetical protein